MKQAARVSCNGWVWDFSPSTSQLQTFCGPEAIRNNLRGSKFKIFIGEHILTSIYMYMYYQEWYMYMCMYYQEWYMYYQEWYMYMCMYMYYQEWYMYMCVHVHVHVICTVYSIVTILLYTFYM